MRKLVTLLSILAVSVLCLVSCGPNTTDPIASKPSIQMEVGSADVMRFFKYTNSVNADEFIYVDTRYVLVDEEWFMANVFNKYNDFMFRNGVAFADKKKNDCDDFARGFSFFSRVKSMQAKFMDSNLAVADVYYRTLDMGHAINAAVVIDKNKQWKLLFIEPQGPQIVKMDEEYKKFYVIYVGL